MHVPLEPMTKAILHILGSDLSDLNFRSILETIRFIQDCSTLPGLHSQARSGTTWHSRTDQCRAL